MDSRATNLDPHDTSPPGMESRGLKRQPWTFALLAALFIALIASIPDHLSDDLSSSDASPSFAAPSTDVFALNGTWDATATTDVTTNAYIAAILSGYIYQGNLKANNLADFSTAFTTHVAKPMGITRAWYYYGPWDTAWAFLDTPTSHLVVFRGTILQKFDNDLTDVFSGIPLGFPRLNGSEVRIGWGFGCTFLNNTNLLMPELLSFRASSDKSDKPLWITGHSLGAALATLFATFAEERGLTVQGVYTFGSPAVGLQDWADSYSPLGSRTYRYFVNSDIVPTLPPNLFDSWVHVGVEWPLAPCGHNIPPRPDPIFDTAEGEDASNTTVTDSVSHHALGATRTTATAAATVGSLFGLFDCTNTLIRDWLTFQTCGLVRVNDTSNPSAVEVISLDCAEIAEGPQPLFKEIVTDLEGAGAAAAAALMPSHMVAAGGAGVAPAAAQVNSTAGVPMTKLHPFASHSIMTSYLPIIYYCTLTQQQKATVPDYWTVRNFTRTVEARE